MKGFFRRIFPLGILILLSYWAVKPFFHTGFFPMHDDTQVARVYEMAQALSSGQFPVRWVQDLGYGYGYPIFNFYAPLPYYIGASFNLLGFDPLTATKIMFMVGIILAGVTMFFFLKNLAGETGAIVGSILYLYAPYHAVNIYVRGAVGELYAVAYLPLILLGILKIINSKDKNGLKKGIILGSLGISGVLLSHNILGMIIGYFLGFGVFGYLIYSVIARLQSSRDPAERGFAEFIPFSAGLAKTNKVFYCLLPTFLLGMSLSSFFILPAIAEKDFTRVNELVTAGSNFSNHFVFLDQLWSSPWGFAGSTLGRLDGMSFMVGKIHLLFGLLSIPITFFLYKRKKITNFQFSIFNFQLLLLLLSVFLMLDQSKFIWEIIPGFAFIQYPWRFLAFTSLSLSVMASILFIPLSKMKRIIFAVISIILIIWFNSRYFIPKEFLSLKADDYTDGTNLRFKVSKISDEYLPKDFTIPESSQDIAWQAIVNTQNLKIINSFETPTGKIFTVDVANSSIIRTNVTYFPGWQVKLDGVNTNIFPKEERIGFAIPAGKHRVEFIFRDTPVRLISNIISILSLFLLIYIIVF